MTILADSPHSRAFEGKRDGLLALIQKYPDRNIEQTCEALAEKVDRIEIPNAALALLESWVANARPYEPPEQWVCREHLELDGDGAPCCYGAKFSVDHFRAPYGMFYDPQTWPKIEAQL